METMITADTPAAAAGSHTDDIVRIEIEREGLVELVTLEIQEREDLLGHVRERLELDVDVLLFERDGDEPLTCHAKGRHALRLVAHRHRLITVEVRYEHRTIERTFAPAKTVFKVLQWAVGKHGYDLDPTSAARANLILPGADLPLPRESAIGKFTQPGECVLVVDLTLRDFTNG
jgi:hypothetical protein